MSSKNSQGKNVIPSFEIERGGSVVVDFAIKVFHSHLTAMDWLCSPNSEFEGQVPLDMMSSIQGQQKVIKTLNRIDNNIYN